MRVSATTISNQMGSVTPTKNVAAAKRHMSQRSVECIEKI